MAARKGAKNSLVAEDESSERRSDTRLIANLLALMLIRDRPLIEQAGVLAAAGFAPMDIAPLLGTTPASVRQSIYMWRKGKSDQRGQR